MKFLILIAVLLNTACSKAQQATVLPPPMVNDSVKVFDCRGKQYIIEYPKREVGKINSQNYTEGYFFGVSYKDLSSFQIHCGSGTQRPLLRGQKYIATDSVSEKGYVKRIGMNGDGNWREDFYPSRNVTIMYVNVKKEYQIDFDKSLDDFRSKFH